ncbi:MAG TPA: response regulator [Croceibacterium sp.]|nr:response regulator [Croceibacterium sp.]
MSSTPRVQPSILLVEDDDAVRRSLQLLLSAHGYQVRSYPSAVGLAGDSAALGCACVIADLMIPQTDALQLLAELRGKGWAGKAVLISGFLDPRWERKARAAGYDAVLPKPISDSVLVRTVAALLPCRTAI